MIVASINHINLKDDAQFGENFDQLCARLDAIADTVGSELEELPRMLAYCMVLTES
jgi:ABC-type Zn uptake system ZnuABC Zn-binding protein ZnuA